MLKIYHNPQCSKSRQGLEFLKNSGEDFEITEYLKNPPSEEELREIVSLLNVPAEDLVRKNEAVWKEKYKGKSFSEEEIIQILAKNPRLIERPIVIGNGRAAVGRPVENIGGLLTNRKQK